MRTQESNDIHEHRKPIPRNEEMHKMQEKNDEIDMKKVKEDFKNLKKAIIERIKSPRFWIDNIILIILLIIVIYLWYQGKFIEREIIEVCNGVPIP